MLREKAYKNMHKQAQAMQKKVAVAQGKLILDVGDMVRIGIANVDRGKTDCPTVAVVVVEVVQFGEKAIEFKYRVACRAGVLKSLYARPYVIPITHCTADHLGLTRTLRFWSTMPTISERVAVAGDSAVGGQGMLRCDCKGTCLMGRCSCRSAVPPRVCNSRCHHSNKNCKNQCVAC